MRVVGGASKEAMHTYAKFISNVQLESAKTSLTRGARFCSCSMKVAIGSLMSYAMDLQELFSDTMLNFYA
jgi:hypothetical protein